MSHALSIRPATAPVGPAALTGGRAPAAAHTPAGPPRIVAHRGGALLAPENTMAAFRAGLAAGARTLECDVRLTRDGHLAVHHDDTITRMAAPTSVRTRGRVADLTRAQLEQVELRGGHRIPFLEDVLALAGAAGASVYIEVKVADAAEPVARMIREMRTGEAAHAGDAVISFHPDALQVVGRILPDVDRSFLVHWTRRAAFDVIESVGARWLGARIDGIRAGAVTEAHRRGLRVNVWTVNSHRQLSRALASGADTVTTDDPHWAARRLGLGSAAH